MTGAAERRHALLIGLNFAAVYILWGSTYLAIRYGVQDLPPALMAGARFLIAGVILFAWLLWRRVPLPPRAMLVPIAVTGTLLLVAGNGMVTYAEITVPSGMAAVIIANVPFCMVTLEAMRRDGEPITLLVAIGLLAGFAGMLILMWPRILHSFESGLGDLRGELALLVAILSWAVGSIYGKHRIRDVAPLMGVALEMLLAGLLLTLIGLGLGEAPRFHLTPRGAVAIGWLVVAGSLFGYSAYIWLLTHVPAAKVSTYAYVNPVIAVALGWLFLDEVIDLRMAAGTVVILAGVAAVNLARVRLKT